MPANEKTLRSLALSLPATSEKPCYGTPAWYVKKKLFARLLDDGKTVAVRCDFAEREALLEVAPKIFHLTPHYQDWPMVLIRLPAIDRAGLRERLVEAHAKNALATSGAEVAGPGLAGALIKLVGAPFALVADALLLFSSVFILRGLKITENLKPKEDPHFWRDLKEGLAFVRSQKLLVALASAVGCWQLCHQCAR